MSDHIGRDRLSLLRTWLPPEFTRRVVIVAPGASRIFDEAEWEDALVVVEQGWIEVQCMSGSRRSFVSGDVLCLIGLSVEALHNRGHERAVLVAVSRTTEKREQPPR